ncbi:putative short-chain dehydrogenase [Aulographum hederae CBS 113979]|uniref:Putative short-chain dehydrogenase n=1 Tax=Aulographum hederae CBS 113979 TaxID=1176131 RepID=A0A6G1H4R5_9PEZI|nr:putative short-chain dehydrogenase [Aulographum hederae CBS 113979]
MPILSAAHGVSSTIFSNLFIDLPYPAGGDLSGQTVIVTGANTGLGLECSRHLVRLGVQKLIMGVRNLDKGAKAKQDILASTQKEESCIEVWPIEMASYASVQDFAARAAGLPRLDVLVANAGLMTTDFSIYEDNETTITVNVVNTLLLCLLLLPKMRQSAAQSNVLPRIVIPNSALHYLAPLKELEGDIFANLNSPKTADMASRYPLSKLLIIYAIRELASRVDYVAINTPNPSFCKSGLVGEDPGFGTKLFEKVLARSTEMGSRALVHGALSGKESHGQYLTNCHVQIPSSSVTNAKGARIQKAFFDQLVEKLERIVPGVMSRI